MAVPVASRRQRNSPTAERLTHSMPRALVLSLCLLSLLAAPTPAAGAMKMLWGPATLPDGTSAFPTYRDLGVEMLQFQLSWRQVAPTRPAKATDPADPAYRWPADLGATIAEAGQNGIGITLMVKETPRWANGGRSGKWVPRDLGDYADFMAAASRRYPAVRHWMIWGEPDRGDTFAPMPAGSRRGPRMYARLLDRAYGSLKRVSRRNVVIGGNTWTYGVVPPGSFIKWMRMPNGKPPRMDLFGHNPFSIRFPKLSLRPYHPGARDFSDIDTYYREISRAYRGRRVPRLFLSEFTMPSAESNVFNAWVPPDEQAERLAAAYRIAGRLRYVAGLGWFQLLDSPQIAVGLMTTSGERKPAYRAYKDAL